MPVKIRDNNGRDRVNGSRVHGSRVHGSGVPFLPESHVIELSLFGAGVASLAISLVLLSRFIAFWWSAILLLSTPVWIYLALTVGVELDARHSTRQADEMDRRLEQIAEEHKSFHEQAEQDEKNLEEQQRLQAEAWKKELEAAGDKQD